MNSIYVIAASKDGPCKLGFSRDPSRRLKQLQTGYPEPLTLFHVEPVEDVHVRIMEGFIHSANRHRKVSGEWFDLNVEDAILEVKHAIIRYGDSSELRLRRKF